MISRSHHHWNEILEDVLHRMDNNDYNESWSSVWCQSSSDRAYKNECVFSSDPWVADHLFAHKSKSFLKCLRYPNMLQVSEVVKVPSQYLCAFFKIEIILKPKTEEILADITPILKIGLYFMWRIRLKVKFPVVIFWRNFSFFNHPEFLPFNPAAECDVYFSQNFAVWGQRKKQFLHSRFTALVDNGQKLIIR